MEARSHTPAELAKKKHKQMVEVTPKVSGSSGIYRNAFCPDGLLKHLPGAATLYEALDHGKKVAGDNARCLGFRPKILGEQKWGNYEWLTYGEVCQRRLDVGSGLRKLHVSLGGDDDEKFGVGLYAVNRPEWLIAEHGSHSQALVIVALFDTFGPANVEYVVNHSGMRVIFATFDKVASLVDQVVPKCPSLKAIISMDGFPSTSADGKSTAESWEALGARAEEAGVKLLSMLDLEQKGREDPVPPRPPKPEDVTTICYTSGTTGNPKGALLTHENFISVAAGLNVIGVTATPQDVHISYLPYAHVFERVATAVFLWGGCQIGYFRGEIPLLFEDIGLLRPTIFVSVPRLLNRVHAAILAKTVDSGNAITATLFKRAMDGKLKALKNGSLTHTFWDALVFNKIKALLGGRIRFIVSGSAPISAKVIAFLKAAFSCDLIEGYGSTESTGGSTVTWLGDHSAAGTIGAALPCCEVKLFDIPDMNYLSTDKPEPRGEICLRGPSIFKGYHKDPSKTKETIDEDGWLHTGDVGKIDKYNRTVIIDRVKNMFKLAQGEYVAPEKLENVYVRHECVGQIFIHGEGLQSEIVAVAVVEPEAIVKRAIRLGIAPANTPIPGPILPGAQIPEILIKLAADKDIIAGILEDLQKLGKSNKLAGFEIPRGLFLTADPMTIENGLLTPTMKIKRNVAQDFFKNEIAAMYAAINAKKSSKTEAAKL
ncbi:Long chain acyl-CoA synthetase 7 peroxisomal [Phlyctochytrium planicorne]|nr:Long chain acyl-CoA synthetase 7 peroxisomal [Phlyctochytrium planicorne]